MPATAYCSVHCKYAGVDTKLFSQWRIMSPGPGPSSALCASAEIIANAARPNRCPVSWLPTDPNTWVQQIIKHNNSIQDPMWRLLLLLLHTSHKNQIKIINEDSLKDSDESFGNNLIAEVWALCILLLLQNTLHSVPYSRHSIQCQHRPSKKCLHCLEVCTSCPFSQA